MVDDHGQFRVPHAGRRLDLLIDRYGRRAMVTPQVLDEVLDGIAAGYRALETIREAVEGGKLGTEESLSEGGREVYLTLIRTLGPGDASCIAYAQSREGPWSPMTGPPAALARSVRCR